MYEGARIRLQGLVNEPASVIPKVKGDQVQQWNKKMEVWAVAMI